MTKAKKNNFDFNKKSMTLFQKFVGFLNEVTDEVKEVEKIADADETESGEAVLKYQYDDEKFYEVGADGFVTDMEGEKLTDGEYALMDGSALVVTDGKFDGTILKEDAENTDKVETEIAQSDDEENKEDKADEEKKDDEKSDEGDTKEEDKKDEEEKKDDVSEEEKVEQEGELVPFQVNGVDYMLPMEVVDYINSLTSTSEVFRKEIAQIKQRIPSTKPTTTAPIVQKKEVKANLYDRVNMFRMA